ncbi:MAG: PD40 domain-containing protein, partial [Bacteroidetes bacterium]|nr:PD40 domain-containing protein [Bacteroidota bacterium]
MFSTLFSNHSTLRKIILLCLGVFILQSVPCYRSIAQFYNGSHTDFGKSRVQHRKFFWYFYRFREFNVYFYTGCKEPADYVVKTADSIISEMERFLDYTLDEKIFFIVFNNLRELQQSNIGFVTDQMYNTGGITRVVGTKIFLQHEGSYTNLREQIRSGIAETVINQMLMGGTIRDRLKSSTLLVLPEWYTKGLVSYAAKGWSTEMDNYIKDGVKSGKIRKFNNLSGADAILTGHAIWNYIAERYGHSVIPGILYMTKLSRNIESGFLYVLGTSLSTLTYDCLDYYLARADADDGNRSSPPTEPILVKSRQQTLYGNFRLNHDKKYAVYTSNNRGKFKLLLYDVNNNRSSVLFKGGYKREEIINDNYPVAAWHPSKNILTIFFEKKGRLWIRMIDPESEKNPVILTREMHQLNNIFDFSYHPDGNKLVMSAVKQSQNDIFVYGISSNNIEQVTDDIFDDRQPQFTSDGKKIIFSSNRSADTLYTLKTDHFSDSATFPVPNSNKDIFIYNSQSRSRMLGRLTGSHDIDESAPEEYSPGLYTYLSDRNGIVNRYLVKTDSVISHIDTIAHYRATLTTLPMTNYARNILDQNVPDGSNSITELIRHDDDFNFYIHEKRDASELSEIRAPETAYRRILEKETEKKRKAKEKSGREEEADPFKSLDILFMEDTSGTVEPEGKKSE